MNRKELFYFTGSCLSLDENPQNVEIVQNTLRENRINWDMFVRLASDHLVLQTLHCKFRNHNLLPLIPVELLEFMDEIYNLAINQNKQIIGQIEEIVGLMNHNGIKPLFLKGAANLIDGLYSDPGERIMGDIDFLVPEKEYLKAASILEGIGYRPPEVFFGDVMEMKHYPRLTHPEKPVSVEVHRLPVNPAYAGWFNAETAWNNASSAKNMSGCFVLTDNYKLILNFVHSQLSNKGSLYGNVSLRDLYDLLLLTKKVSLNEILPKIREKRKAEQYFALSEEVLGIELGYVRRNRLIINFLKLKHNLNFSSFFFYKLNKIAVRLYERLIIGYFGQIIKSVYSKSVRKSVINRITNPKWYKSHLKSWEGFTK